MNEIVEIKNLSKTYRRGGEPIHVLSGVNLNIQDGGYLALMGPSGSGKTTLLNMIGGLDRPTKGSVKVCGVEIATLKGNALAKWRSHNIGFVFQFYNLMDVLSAQRNVELPLLLTKLSRKERRERALTALEVVGLADRAKHKPAELSGGQLQRVAIARALVADQRILVCDEPTGDLDRTAANQILDLLEILNSRHGKTIVMVTHDPEAAKHAHECLHLDKGRLTREAA